MLTIAQITDLHITTDRDPVNRLRNETRLRTVLRAIHDMQPRPAAILASGDLADTGAAEEYAILASILRDVEIPFYLGVGNHDRRGPILRTFAPPVIHQDVHGFIQYTVDIGGVRVVMCDTLEEGRDEGAFCQTRAHWLGATLDAAPDTPTVVVLHHPPIPSGIQWMDPAPDADWIGRLADVLRGRDQVVTAVCGHVHRAYHGIFAGQLVSVSTATALQLTLNMTPVDMFEADGRQILLGEPPGFTLLCWDRGRLTTHHCVAGDFPDSITYDSPFIKP